MVASGVGRSVQPDHASAHAHIARHLLNFYGVQMKNLPDISARVVTLVRLLVRYLSPWDAHLSSPSARQRSGGSAAAATVSAVTGGSTSCNVASRHIATRTMSPPPLRAGLAAVLDVARSNGCHAYVGGVSSDASGTGTADGAGSSCGGHATNTHSSNLFPPVDLAPWRGFICRYYPLYATLLRTMCDEITQSRCVARHHSQIGSCREAIVSLESGCRAPKTGNANDAVDVPSPTGGQRVHRRRHACTPALAAVSHLGFCCRTCYQRRSPLEHASCWVQENPNKLAHFVCP